MSNKKSLSVKTVSILLVLVLLVGMAAGGTVAWLIDASHQVVNTFTYGDINIELEETDTDLDGDSNPNTNEYEMVPGRELKKDPIVTVLPDSEAHWLFVKVENKGGDVTVDGTPYAFKDFLTYSIATGWTPLDETNHPGVYYIAVDKDTAKEGKAYHVIEGDKVTVDTDVTKAMVNALDANGTKNYPQISVIAYAIQSEGFTDVKVAWDEVKNAQLSPDEDPVVTKTDVANDTDFENALKDTTSDAIVVNLTGDVTYDVAAWAQNAMGGTDTETITINGNGKTITFHQTNSDWNNITTGANGAKLIINNAKITNSGHNDGPWNRHDLNFACDVEMNNVTSDKAFAFKAGAVLNNVTINDANTSDTYAIWIQPNGQTVTLDGCTIDMTAATDGRGIKIDEQYVTTPAKVTLKVSNTVFKTEEKSAILVKSVAGADITLDNINITGVAADSTNAVWVDEASTAYADLVTVTGGNKILEP